MYKRENKLTLILDSHQLGSAQDCLQKHNYESIRNLAPITARLGMSKGTAWHKVLEYYYTLLHGGQEINSSAQATFLWWQTEQTKEEYSNLDLAAKSKVSTRLLEYVKQWKNQEYKPLIAPEKGFSKVLYEDDNVLFIYEGLIDLVSKISDKTIWIDHKTQHPAFSKDLYQYSNQFIGYCWALGCNHGVVNYTTWSESITDKTFRRPFYSYNDDIIKVWRQDTILAYREILLAYIRNKFPRERAACDGKYGLCPFTTICEQPFEKIREAIIRREYKEGPVWSPW